jgi:hypothetical protein
VYQKNNERTVPAEIVDYESNPNQWIYKGKLPGLMISMLTGVVPVA